MTKTLPIPTSCFARVLFRKPVPTFRDHALAAAATLAIAAATVPTTADARCIGCAVGAGERPAEAPPGYVYYPGYGQQLPGPNCNWFRLPVYDAYGNMVGWQGRPAAFCSWLAGYRPWPPL
jgi:hypothetical protein